MIEKHRKRWFARKIHFNSMREFMRQKAKSAHPLRSITCPLDSRRKSPTSHCIRWAFLPSLNVFTAGPVDFSFKCKFCQGDEVRHAPEHQYNTLIASMLRRIPEKPDQTIDTVDSSSSPNRFCYIPVTVCADM